MKKTALSLLFLLFFTRIWACIWYSPDAEYYNLFIQEVIASPRYFPFLRTVDNAYYLSESKQNERNENIEAWQKHLGLSYQQAYYLVFKCSRTSLQNLINGKDANDPELSFIDADFAKEHKQDLQYLAYAKYLEPYMSIIGSGSRYWVEERLHTADELNYKQVINELLKGWETAADKNLKLRYGYQLVRFAHYNRKYEEAINYFNTHVERLDYRPIMYYYALDQKGGAERGSGNLIQANYDFFQFFSHTKNRKKEAYTSMTLSDGLDYKNLLEKAKGPEEQNDIYLLLGYNDFNNPISSFEKIVEHSPNAVQAKVLMARAINQLERTFFPLSYHCPYNDKNCFDHIENHRLPLKMGSESIPFLQQTLKASLAQMENPAVKDRSFWGLSSAYLYFIQKKYEKAREYLAGVENTSPLYSEQKDKLAMLIDISEQKTITPRFEQTLIDKYKSYLGEKSLEEMYTHSNSTKSFIIDILANRYFLQKDYAKAFLLQNNITDLAYKPNMEILEGIEKLYYKKNKSAFEKYIAKNIVPSFGHYPSQKNEKYVKDFDFGSYVANMKGSVLLSQSDFKNAKKQFSRVKDGFNLFPYDYVESDSAGHYIRKPINRGDGYNGYSNISDQVFGYNRIECFECPPTQVMQSDYLEEFPFIEASMNKKTLTDALLKLKKIGKGKGEKAAKANYLIGNFFFNTSLLGYYRQLLTFDINNSKGEKFHNYRYFIPYQSNVFYFKGYSWKVAYIDDFQLPLDYLNRALSLTQNDELKARILFAAAKCEQGIFYSTDDDEAINAVKKLPIYSKEYGAKMDLIRFSKYKDYFKQLKNYEQTDFYKEIKTNCKYFDYYVTHY